MHRCNSGRYITARPPHQEMLKNREARGRRASTSRPTNTSMRDNNKRYLILTCVVRCGVSRVQRGGLLLCMVAPQIRCRVRPRSLPTSLGILRDAIAWCVAAHHSAAEKGEARPVGPPRGRRGQHPQRCAAIRFGSAEAGECRPAEAVGCLWRSRRCVAPRGVAAVPTPPPHATCLRWLQAESLTRWPTRCVRSRKRSAWRRLRWSG